MWRFLSVSQPVEPAEPPPEPPRPPVPGREGMTFETKPVRYARYGEEEHAHNVTVCFVGSGQTEEEAAWHKFSPAKFTEFQARLPFGTLHPRCQEVLDVMRPVPPGARVHPDRNRLATGTTVSALLGSNRWLERDARAEGYRSASDLLVARAAGKAVPVRSNKDMDRGVNEEPEALTLVERLFGLQLARDKPMGLLVHPSHELGASPDGILARVPCLVEIKSKRNKTDIVMPIDHYWQVQCQMLSTANEKGVPRITNVLYVQYVSHPPSGHPVLSVRLVQFNAKHGTRLLECAHEHVMRIREAGVPSIEPVRGGGMPQPERKEQTPSSRRGARTAARGGGRGRRFVPYWPPSRKLMKRLRVHKV